MSPRSPNAPGLQLVGNAPHRCYPWALDLVNDAPQVGGVLGSLGFDGRNGVRVAHLFAAERSGPIGIT